MISTVGANDNNYDFAYVDGVLTITKTDLLVTADNKTREYGDANPVLTYTYGSFKNAETSAVLDTAPSISTAAIATTNVGTPAITLSGGLDNNYNYVFTNGTLTITKATLTATADNQTREYGDANPVLTTTYTGFKNSETSAVIDTLATASNPSTPLTTVSTSAITTAGANDNNYDFIYVDGVLNIIKANLTVTVDHKTREYGDANPVLTYTYGSFKNAETSAVLDTAPTIATGAIATTNAGTQAITLSGGLDDQYNYVFVDGILTINKAPLVIQVGNATRIEGDPEPPFNYTILSGLKFADPASSLSGVALSTPANIFSPLGLYAINASGGTATNYYVSSYLPGILTITTGVIPPMPSSFLPDTFYQTDSITGHDKWYSWRDIIFYEDEELLENILFGHQVVTRRYRL